jgi:hypothetical protein
MRVRGLVAKGDGEIMAYRQIVAVYDKVANASDAADALRASGFPACDISLLSRDSFGDTEIMEPRLLRRLFGDSVGERESVIYGRTIEAGGAVLTLRVPYGDGVQALKVLDTPKPMSVREHSASQDSTTSSAQGEISQTPAHNHGARRRDRGKASERPGVSSSPTSRHIPNP